MSKELLDLVVKLRASKFIKEKTFPDFPGLSAFNFTRDAFWEGEWNAETIKARGLFIDTEKGEVVARGYNKFFNIGERPETQPAQIRKDFQASEENPIEVSLKENGFLGIAGVYRDTLFLASKSTPEGEFAQYFKDLLTEQQKVELFNYLKEKDCCATFEVIDPIHDPHIIEENVARVVLLDVFKRDINNMVKLPSDEVMFLSKRLGFPYSKTVIHTFFNNDDFHHFLDGFLKAEAEGDVTYGTHLGKHIEGVVIEDSQLNMTKAKFPFYAHWKWARSTLDNWQRLQELDEGKAKQEKLKNFTNKVQQHHSKLVKNFGLWLLSLDGGQKAYVQEKCKNIVNARKIYVQTDSYLNSLVNDALTTDVNVDVQEVNLTKNKKKKFKR
jgi:tRNA splicing ligase